MLVVTTLVITQITLAHSFYPESCCGGKDCHPVPCEEITRLPSGGYEWMEHGHKIYFKLFAPSQDSQCHVCVRHLEWNPDVPGSGICLFLAPQT